MGIDLFYVSSRVFQSFGFSCCFNFESFIRLTICPLLHTTLQLYNFTFFIYFQVVVSLSFRYFIIYACPSFCHSPVLFNFLMLQRHCPCIRLEKKCTRLNILSFVLGFRCSLLWTLQWICPDILSQTTALYYSSKYSLSGFSMISLTFFSMRYLKILN